MKNAEMQLDPAYIRRAHTPRTGPTLAEVEALTAEDSAVLPVVGDCMEGAGIPDGGFVAVSFRHFPRPPKYKKTSGFDRHDACLCWLTYRGRSYAGIKEYDGVWGRVQMVGTRYKQYEDRGFRMNAGMFADRIFGVVFACWDPAGRPLWQRDLANYPRELGTTPTIHGDNIGDPQPVAAVKSPKPEKCVHVGEGVNMITGCPGSSSVTHNLETGSYIIRVNEHDDPLAVMQRALTTIRGWKGGAAV